MHLKRKQKVKYRINKSEWEHLMVVHAAEEFPDLFGQPIAPTRKRWRRLCRLARMSGYFQKGNNHFDVKS
ncbi:hypothetical protein [Loigolactobacillus jiayinensis]|uniref:Uncharacterized protein n=1 Tax=Loigolactobacillus jiayinensis TaxID=2486016 RepID=A0ABW1RFE9_9LACO|nr:hypothetical protein [Loigolactobacillus jiayinensis]